MLGSAVPLYNAHGITYRLYGSRSALLTLGLVVVQGGINKEVITLITKDYALLIYMRYYIKLSTKLFI